MEVKTDMVRDPVCGMQVNEKTATLKSEYMGETYYFCNQACKIVFDRNPQRFTAAPSTHEGHGCGCCCQ